jgi:transposase
MDNEDARKLDPEAQQELRKTAVELRQLGHTYKAISTIVRVSPNTIWKWCRSYDEHGDAGITSKRRGRRPGAGRSLSSAQEAEIVCSIGQGTPDQIDLPFALWSRRAVQALIRHRYAQDMPLRTVGAYVRRWGFATPATLSFTQDPAPLRLQQLLGKDYPYVVQRARAASAQIHWCELVDGWNHVTRESARPPIRWTLSNPMPEPAAPWSMISTVSARGKLRWMVFDEPVDAQMLGLFLHQLLKETKDRILLMMDGRSLEELQPVQRWLSDSLTRVEVLPTPRSADYREAYGETSTTRMVGPMAPD